MSDAGYHADKSDSEPGSPNHGSSPLPTDLNPTREDIGEDSSSSTVSEPPTGDPVPVEKDEQIDIKLVPDGGVVKRVLLHGIGKHTPMKGDEVTVHYVGKLLDGTQFDSSKDHGPFKFHLGEEEVIKGWDIGVKTMRLKEKCLLTCKPDYAYGANGAPPSIPPDSTLQFEVELLEWSQTIDASPKKDGGVLVQRLEEGSGWKKPKNGYDIKLRYEEWLIEGTSVGTNKEHEFPLSFTMGDGTVPRGWELALKEMKLGGKAMVTLSSEYAHGPEGKPPSIPPNADMKVFLHLEGFAEWEDKSASNTGEVMVKVDTGGTGYQTPNDGAEVTVHITAHFDSVATGTLLWDSGDIKIIVGDGQVAEGLDLALGGLHLNEAAYVKLKGDYAARGFLEDQGTWPETVEKGALIECKVEVKTLEETKQSWQMDDEQKLAAAIARKNRGNFFVKHNRLRQAVEKYTRSLDFVSADYNTKKSSCPPELTATMLACHNNMALCKLKLKEYHEVVKKCDEALAIDGDNIKALFRRAQANVHLDEDILAEKDYKQGLVLDPNNAELKAGLKQLKLKRKKQDAKARKAFGGMFEKLAKEDDAYSQRASKPHKSEDANVDMDEDYDPPAAEGEIDPAAIAAKWENEMAEKQAEKEA